MNALHHHIADTVHYTFACMCLWICAVCGWAAHLIVSKQSVTFKEGSQCRHPATAFLYALSSLWMYAHANLHHKNDGMTSLLTTVFSKILWYIPLQSFIKTRHGATFKEEGSDFIVRVFSSSFICRTTNHCSWQRGKKSEFNTLQIQKLVKLQISPSQKTLGIQYYLCRAPLR